MLVRDRRRRANIATTLVQLVVFAGMPISGYSKVFIWNTKHLYNIYTMLVQRRRR